MSKHTLKVSVTDSKFLEKSGHKVVVNGEEWFYMPFWFHKAEEGIFVQYPFEDLPDHVLQRIRTERALTSNNKP